MSDLFKLDKSSCVKCGACVKDCAFNALKLSNEWYPEIPQEATCMKCQHCFAICPKGAIVFDGKRPQDSIETKNLELPNAIAVENWLRTRRSCRFFKDEDVNQNLIDKILKTLGNVPTGCNARSLTFTCISTREAMNGFRQDFLHAIEEHREGNKLLPRWLALPAILLRKGVEDIFFRGAPSMLIVSSDETAPGVTTPNEDVIAACTYFEMLAEANGLATCWCGFLKMITKEIPEILEKTTGLRRTTPFYAMLFGFPKVRYPRSVQRDSYANIIYRR